MADGAAVLPDRNIVLMGLLMIDIDYLCHASDVETALNFTGDHPLQRKSLPLQSLLVLSEYFFLVDMQLLHGTLCNFRQFTELFCLVVIAVVLIFPGVVGSDVSLSPDDVHQEIVGVSLGRALVEFALLHQNLGSRKFGTGLKIFPLCWIFGDRRFQHCRLQAIVGGSADDRKGMAVEAYPNETQILYCFQYILCASEAWPMLISLSHSHVLSLFVDLPQEKFFHVFYLKGLVDSCDVFSQDIVQFKVKFYLWKVLFNLFLADAIISE